MLWINLIDLFNRLAQRIVQGDVPQALMNRKVCALFRICSRTLFSCIPFIMMVGLLTAIDVAILEIYQADHFLITANIPGHGCTHCWGKV